MSRIGKMPIPIPSGTTVTVAKDGATVTVKGPKGQLTRTLPLVSVKIDGPVANLATTGETHDHSACHGLSRALLANMVTGCATGHKRNLIITGTGYKAEVWGQQLTLALGFSHPIVFEVPAGLKVGIEEKGTVVTLEGPDKELLGQVSANIRAFRPPEPYKGKGIRYSDETIRRKAGKTGK